MLGFSRMQLFLLFCAGLAVLASASVKYAGARLADPLTLVAAAGDPAGAASGATSHGRSAGIERLPGAERPTGTARSASDERSAGIDSSPALWSAVAHAAEPFPTLPQAAGIGTAVSHAAASDAPGADALPAATDGLPAGASGGEACGPVAASGDGAAGASHDPRRDLNRMTLEDLLALPGIGPVIAQRILDFRFERGRFDRVEQLLEIKGIGPARFAQLRTLVWVGAPPGPPPHAADETDCPASAHA